jgi:hypothetical protein
LVHFEAMNQVAADHVANADLVDQFVPLVLRDSMGEVQIAVGRFRATLRIDHVSVEHAVEPAVGASVSAAFAAGTLVRLVH